MTKKEKQHLHTTKCVIEQTQWQSGMGEVSRFLVGFSLNGSELVALVSALETSPRTDLTPVLNHQKDDVLAFLKNALERAGIKV